MNDRVAGRKSGHPFSRGRTSVTTLKLDETRRFRGRCEDTAMRRKKFSAIVLATVLLPLGNPVILAANSQDPGKPKSNAEADVPPATANKRLTIEVTGGEKNVAVADASVYFKFNEGRTLRKDRKYALNVKTNREGMAHIPDPPLGNVLIQVVAEGWKSYGQYYELKDAGTVIKIHLDRPPKWY